ncbi:hypothetical protein G7Y89_g920 [Cudoniella acicularis]|uniref:V-ATPase proteolipid subunit C-like domain-containing protein n=1 Tax=Cudoniella acicularis TaxID=354080 RepID=A0A8H4W7H3_9HELO|nr:hypothetical protein G7Y89_g920 [Cudoniella acicularis]
MEPIEWIEQGRCPVYASFFGAMGCSMAVVLSVMGAAYGIAKSGVGVSAVSVLHPETMTRSSTLFPPFFPFTLANIFKPDMMPPILAGILSIYGLVTGVMITNNLHERSALHTNFMQLAAGLSCGLCCLSAGFCIGIVGDAGVRGNAQQPRLYVGMMLMLIFAEVLGESLLLGAEMFIGKPGLNVVNASGSVRLPNMAELESKKDSRLRSPAEPTCLEVDSTPPSASSSKLQPIDVLDNYIIFNNLCSHLDIAGLLALKRVTKRWTSHLSTYLKNRWNINKKLKRFVQNPQRLRSELARHDAVISGSFVLQLLDSVVWEESDLDIYVEDTQDAFASLEIRNLLTQKEGYEFKSRSGTLEFMNSNRYPVGDILKTDTLLRKWREGSEEKVTKVQIISTKIPAPLAIIGDFYTSALINFITWNKIYSIFPDSTFLDHETLRLRNAGDEETELIAKYAERGWQTKLELREAGTLPARCIQNISNRRLGDSNSWIIALDTEGITNSPTPDAVIDYSWFKISPVSKYGSLEFNESKRYHIKTNLTGSCVLRYRYSFPPTGWNWCWANQMRKLNELTRAEIEKMPAEDRPAWFANAGPRFEFYGYNSRINKPPTWLYYDEKITMWYEWEKKKIAEASQKASPVREVSSLALA